MALVEACSGTKTVTSTVTGAGGTTTVTKTATTTVAGPSGSIVTVTQGGATVTQGGPTVTQTVTQTTPATGGAVTPEGLVRFTVNGVDYAFQVKPHWSLAHVLREGLGLFALKEGCERGECGTCTVIVDGLAVHSCLMMACEMEGKKVTTVEGLSNGGKLSPLQQKYYDNEAWQCGYCTPGFLMAAQALLAVNPKPTMDDVRLAFSGHICMCGDLHRHINATVGGV
jgi:aerobic-type carbon monoxide dehydrogenase small subunit (CoxS/CutS family)